MAIQYHKEKKIFCLDTENSTYLMGLTPEGYLGHIYYGERLHKAADNYMLRMEEPPYTPSVNKREKSSFLDAFPMEYPTGEIGDYRESCLNVRNEANQMGCEIHYVSHEIYKGKKPLKGLPASFGTEEQVQTLDILCEDAILGLQVILSYSVFEQGFTKMAYVGSVKATSSIMDRYCGFYKAQLEHDQMIPKEWVIPDRDKTGHMSIVLPEEMPEAFVCNCDLAAGMVIMELEKKGYRIPEDVSVVGFDNYLYPGFPDKKITSYEVNTQEMAKVALEKALKQIKNPASGRGLSIVSGKIVEKESVRKK